MGVYTMASDDANRCVKCLHSKTDITEGSKRKATETWVSRESCGTLIQKRRNLRNLSNGVVMSEIQADHYQKLPIRSRHLTGK